jgi:PhnB protein
MKTSVLFDFSVDRENKIIKVDREFSASLKNVWAAWTKSELLDQWWAPKPWKAKTKTMDFREGGFWLYAMVGPDGTAQWCRADYKSVVPMKSFSGKDAFCNEDGNIVTNEFPGSFWKTRFTDQSGSTMVNIEIEYKSLSDLEKTIEMGFREGFTAALENLDELLGS